MLKSSDNPAEISARLKEIEYCSNLPGALAVFETNDLLAGRAAGKGAFLLQSGGEEFAMSQWLSPKRTRSYPLARVYDTLCRKNRVTVVPFCKDEGADGDRDFIQWDTVALMSILNVHVIICHYVAAEKNARPGQTRKNKISRQVFDYGYVHRKLGELQNYHSSCLHWNLARMAALPEVVRNTIDAYQSIGAKLGVQMHGAAGLHKRLRMLARDVAEFKALSRDLAETAQRREVMTLQPKEKIGGAKATITVKNFLGGNYYFTADECVVLDGRVFLIEKKHNRGKLLPSAFDLKDAFIKSALFSNIDSLEYNGVAMPSRAVVGLTSAQLRGAFHSNMSEAELSAFFAANAATERERELIRNIIRESQQNKFAVFAMNADETEVKQTGVLRRLA